MTSSKKACHFGGHAFLSVHNFTTKIEAISTCLNKMQHRITSYYSAYCNIPHILLEIWIIQEFTPALPNLLEFEEHLLIKMKKYFQILKKKQTFDLKLYFWGLLMNVREHLWSLEQWLGITDLHKRINTVFRRRVFAKS